MWKIFFLIFISVPSILFAEFEGDGNYKVTTNNDIFLWFDLSNYNLTLPSFPLNKPGKYSWKFKGYCSDNVSFSVFLYTVSPEPVYWSNDKTKVEVVIKDESGKYLFIRNGALNSYQTSYKYSGCKVVDFAQCPPLKTEWTTDYSSLSDYGGKLHEVTSIILSSKDREVKKTEHYYFDVVHGNEIGCGTYYVTASVVQPFWQHNVQGYIEISSTWK